MHGDAASLYLPEMIIVRNKFIPIGKRFAAINLLGILFVKKGCKLDEVVLNHERIHTRQMTELLIVPFYIIYVLEWAIRTIVNGGKGIEAYHSISFEREAYGNECDLGYIGRRKLFAQWRKT